MNYRTTIPAKCPDHGEPTQRASCSHCNAAYMRDYMRRQRVMSPSLPLWERAKRRAKQRGLPFSLLRSEVSIPPVCPVLGIPLITGHQRSAHSPSLDRIVPAHGYVRGNVRVISDRANRLKGNRNLTQLRDRAASGPANLRADYDKVAAYVDREALLAEVRAKAAAEGKLGAEWAKIAVFLDRAFAGKSDVGPT